MRTKIAIVAWVVFGVAFSPAYSKDQTVQGEVSVKGVFVDVDGKEGGRAKFTEYRDLEEDGRVFGKIKLGLDSEKYFFKFNARDFGYDTQSYKMTGGHWGKFKVDLFYHEIPHNVTFDARTFFLGAGRDTLVGPPNTNIRTWNTFDYSVERRQYGGGLKVDMIRPFFFDLSLFREEREGIRPTGAAAEDSGGIGLELPEPVLFSTNHLKLEAGYAKKPLFLSLSYLYSGFNNRNTNLLFVNPATTDPDIHTLPLDNTYYKGAFRGVVKLPLNTRLKANVGFSRGTSETSILPSFDGKVDTRNLNLALTSSPVRFLDVKVYYKYYKRDNKSDDPLGIADLFFDYKINTYGMDLGVRLPARFYLSGGYKYVKTDRERKGETDPEEIFPFNKDHVYFIGLKWLGLDFMTAKIGYEKLDRNADYRTPQTAVQTTRRFAYVAQNRDQFKASLDFFPLDPLAVGLEYHFKNTNYTDTTFGLKNDKRHELNVSVDYTLGKWAKIYGYSDYGWIQFDQLQRRIGFPWEADQRENSFGYGIGTELTIVPSKLKFIFQHDYLKSNGNVDFTLSNPVLFGDAGVPGANNDLIDIMRWDDYTKYGFKFKAVYHITKAFSFSAGYAFERFLYRDAQLDGYQFVPDTVGNNGAFLTGAYKDQSYKAHLIFGGITYKF